MTTERQAWEKREDESDKAYAALRIYLNLGPDRTIDKVRQELGRPSGYTRLLYEWSSKYDWVDRASAWEAHLRDLERQQAEEEHLEKLEAHRRRQQEHAEEMLAASKAAMVAIHERLAELDTDDIEDVTQLARLIRATVELFNASTDAEAEALAVEELTYLIVHGQQP